VQPDINRIEDLRGKTLGVTRFGSVTDNLTQILLRKYNLEGKVNVRQMGGVIEVGAAFQQKLIAGAVSSELRASEQHPAKILIKLIDLGVPYSMDMIVVSRDYLRRQPETAERILRGGNRSAASAKRNSPESHRKVRPSRGPEKNRSTLPRFR
jgi:ABC-type nitrate/sulfonate/bicarbonate transport system substrate-binding protein